jgi:hypothetical protein
MRGFWTISCKRDAALEPYARAATDEDRQRIADALAEELNKL